MMSGRHTRQDTPLGPARLVPTRAQLAWGLAWRIAASVLAILVLTTVLSVAFVR